MPQEYPIDSAVSILSPVIIQKFIPASMNFLISLSTSSCNLSSSAETPNKNIFDSISATSVSKAPELSLFPIDLYFTSEYFFSHLL